MEEIAPVIMGIAMFWFIGWGIRAASANRRQVRLAEMQAELQTRLLDKVGNSQELAEVLRSDVGKNLLVTAPVERTNPYAKILSSVQVGIVLTLAGLVFLATKGWFPETEQSMVFTGAMGLALGVGFLLSAAVSFVLSRSWGLINGDRRDHDEL